MNLLRMFERTPLPAARFAEGRVGYGVGDIHGRADLLAMLLDDLETRGRNDERANGGPVVVFLGDYVDRGPDSKGVIDLLLSGRPYGFERRFLRGNHEQMMQAFMDNPLALRSWVVQGGAETLMSYGVTPPTPTSMAEQEWLDAAAALRAALPQAHLDFLNGLERYAEFGDYAFVHAGVDAARPLESQTDDDLYWARDRFIASRRAFSHRVVHGHTPVDRPFIDDRRVAVDTGAYASGTLTAARLEAERVSFVAVSSRASAAKP
jgi:serine/threonine protein phosphatase 1